MGLRHAWVPLLALGGAAALLGPAPPVAGYSLIGDELDLGQRDFRVYDNFDDPTAGDNQDPDANFPGHQGAVMAIWKGCVEWQSGLHGSGNGDPTQQGDLGSGGANFDPSFQGRSTGVGDSNDNVHSQISGGDGGVLAYTEGGFFSAGWRIRYYETWKWEDGPAAPLLNHVDLQGVACHEYGHALGLGHSSAPGATMQPAISGTGATQRSINGDDAAGVQAIYGARSASKPVIDSISLAGSTLTIRGQGFSSTGNQVWFTNASATSPGSNPPVKLTGVASALSGTEIVVAVPGNAGPGDVMVQRSGSTHSALSNAWPFDPAGDPPPPVITGIQPASGVALSSPPILATLSGNGFDTILGLTFDGAPVPFTLTAAGDVTFVVPIAGQLGAVDVTVVTASGSGTVPYVVVANDPPALVNHTPLVFSGQLGELQIGAQPGAIALLAASPHHTPSILPGVISADIGAGFTTLTLVGSETTPASGVLDQHVLTGGLPPFTTVWFQAAALDLAAGLPMPVSPAVEMLIL